VTSGFAAKLSTKQIEALSQVNGFLSAIADEMLALHTTHTLNFLDYRVEKDSGTLKIWLQM